MTGEEEQLTARHAKEIGVWSSDDGKYVVLRIKLADMDLPVAFEAESLPGIITGLMNSLVDVAKKRPGAIGNEATVAPFRALELAVSFDDPDEPVLVIPIGPTKIGFQIPRRSLEGVCSLLGRNPAPGRSSPLGRKQ